MDITLEICGISIKKQAERGWVKSQQPAQNWSNHWIKQICRWVHIHHAQSTIKIIYVDWFCSKHWLL